MRFQINATDGTSTRLTLSLDDIASARVLSDSSLQVILTNATAQRLESTKGYGDSQPDQIAIDNTDLAGNQAAFSTVTAALAAPSNSAFSPSSPPQGSSRLSLTQAGNYMIAGDINGDGLMDYVYSNTPKDAASPLYVLFGQDGRFDYDLSAIDAGTSTDGFKVNREDPNTNNDRALYHAFRAGDINGDGLDDIIINNIDSNWFYQGPHFAFVLYGKRTNNPVQLTNLTNPSEQGFWIDSYNNVAADNSPTPIATAGDSNGDGLTDILISIPWTDHNPSTDSSNFFSKSQSFLVHGSTASASVDLANQTNAVLLAKKLDPEWPFPSITKEVGDFNGDGLGDFALSQSALGQHIYIIYGQKNSSGVDLIEKINEGNSQYGFSINQDFHNYNLQLSNIGDINGDGFSDIVIRHHNGLKVIFGSANNDNMDLQKNDNGIMIEGYNTWHENIISPILGVSGDINGDGLSDFFLQKDTGAYVIFGKASEENIQLSSIENGIGGFFISYEVTYRSEVWMVNGVRTIKEVPNLQPHTLSADDLNGDGLMDILVSKQESGNIGSNYILYGGTSGHLNSSFVDHMGTEGNDTLTSLGSQTLIGGLGNDTLVASGADVLYAGRGNDTFILNNTTTTALHNPFGSGGNVAQLARIDGGAGMDTIRLVGSGTTLDLTLVANQSGGLSSSLSRIESIERIDMATDTSAQILKLNVLDVVDIGAMNLFNTSTGSGWSNVGGGSALDTLVSRHQLIIKGDASDQVQVKNWTDWSAVGQVSDGTLNYQVYNHNSAYAQLLISTLLTPNNYVVV